MTRRRAWARTRSDSDTTRTVGSTGPHNDLVGVVGLSNNLRPSMRHPRRRRSRPRSVCGQRYLCPAPSGGGRPRARVRGCRCRYRAALSPASLARAARARPRHWLGTRRTRLAAGVARRRLHSRPGLLSVWVTPHPDPEGDRRDRAGVLRGTGEALGAPGPARNVEQNGCRPEPVQAPGPTLEPRRGWEGPGDGSGVRVPCGPRHLDPSLRAQRKIETGQGVPARRVRPTFEVAATSMSTRPEPFLHPLFFSTFNCPLLSHSSPTLGWRAPPPGTWRS